MSIFVKLADNSYIQTKRLLLRPFSMADVDDMFEYASNPENLIFIFPPHLTKDHTRNSIANNFMKAPLGKWAIELKSEHKMIGSIDFVKLDEKDLAAEIGYCLNLEYWGQGLMTEAVSHLTENAFSKFGLQKLEIQVDKENFASCQVALKAGFSEIEEYSHVNKYSGKDVIFKRFSMTKEQYEQQF